MKREPAVAGMFYSSEREVLQKEISSFLSDGVKNKQKHLGVMLPHAGHVYSGATTVKVLENVIITDSVVILCPDHYGLGDGISVYDKGQWATPLGSIDIDAQLVEALLESGNIFSANKAAHDKEHSIEVILPFLQYLKPDVRIVPIMVSTNNINMLLTAGDLLGEVIASLKKDVLIIASSDMTHFESKERALSKDKKAIDMILDMDSEGLFATVRDNNISMCGVFPAVLWLQALKNLSPTDTKLIDYSNSGQVTGDFSEVVAYAGIAVK